MNLQEKLEAAEQLFAAGEYSKATSFFTELFNEQPLNHSVLYKRGHCYFKSKQYDEALIDFNAAIKMYSKLDWYFGSRGSLHLVMNNPKAALEDFSAAIASDSSKGKHYYGLGRANWRLKNYEEALDAFNEADKLGIAVHWEMKVNCLMFLKRLEQAIEHCNQEIITNPRDYRPHLKKGVCFHYLGWKQMEDFIQLNEFYSIEELLAEGEELLYSAIESLSMAIHLNNSESAYRYRGLSYNLLHEYRQAYEDFHAFVCINPTDDFINRIYLKTKESVLGHSGLVSGDKVKYLTGNILYTVESTDSNSGKTFLKNGNEKTFECLNADRLQKANDNSVFLYYNIPDLPHEEWSIVGESETMLVSSLGRVKSCKSLYNEKLFKIYTNSNDDCFIKFKSQRDEKSKYKSLALLVAKVFVPNPNNYKFVQHLNSDLSDNSVKNLAWIISGTNPKSPTTEYFDEQNERKEKQQSESRINSQPDSYEIDDPEFHYYSKRGESTTDWLDEETDGYWRWNID